MLDFSNEHYAFIFQHPTWWSSIFSPTDLTFIDFIKDIVSTLLSYHLKAITQSFQLSSEIIHTFLHEVFNLS